ncbi:MAG: DUF4260 family protein [Ahrensia sp.]|nr:DUF4260 family protein [Ahrensia sp.]
MTLLLKLEHLALFLAALVAYWLFAAFILVPDLSFAGYIAGPKTGSFCYNACHSWLGPVGLSATTLLLDWQLEQISSRLNRLSAGNL